LYLRFQPHNFQAIDVADLLRALVGHLRGPIMRLWDRGSMHRGSAIDAVYQAHLRLHLEEFPVYAPALNPTEQVWNDCKGHIASSRLRNTRELRWCLAASAPSRNGARSSAVPSCPRHHKGGLIAYAKPNNCCQWAAKPNRVGGTGLCASRLWKTLIHTPALVHRNGLIYETVFL
jgi:DDE superfamily endonuclease